MIMKIQSFVKRHEGLGSKIILPRFARVALHFQHGGIIVHVNFWFRTAYHCFERKVMFTFIYACKYLSLEHHHSQVT